MKSVLMSDDFLNFDQGPEKFTNAEYYYLISCLLGLGDAGFVPEKLFLSFDQPFEPTDVKFLFLTEQVYTTEKGEEVKIDFHLGKLDSEFDDMEIYSGRCNPEELNLEDGKIDEVLISTNLRERTYPNEFRPITFLKGITKIVSQPDFKKRKSNDLFKFCWNSPIPVGIKDKFDFGRIGPLNTDFSGDYFLVVSPDEKNPDVTKIKSFKVHDNEDPKFITDYVQYRIDVKHSFIDSHSIQLYQQDESASMFVGDDSKGNENFEKHKAGILPVLTETVLSMLNDLSPETKQKLLEDETPEELVVYCKEKYDREFDLNADTLGVAGAHEIAWQETMAVLNDDFWSSDWKIASLE
ncbi:MAG TPA: hypothetical protein VGQ59_10525 [Cyclobacteriaceae bacterium]|nr:hypothetical protein [Cyclobacteriaceae bacterium]